MRARRVAGPATRPSRLRLAHGLAVALVALVLAGVPAAHGQQAAPHECEDPSESLGSSMDEFPVIRTGTPIDVRTEGALDPDGLADPDPSRQLPAAVDGPSVDDSICADYEEPEPDLAALVPPSSDPPAAPEEPAPPVDEEAPPPLPLPIEEEPEAQPEPAAVAPATGWQESPACDCPEPEVGPPMPEAPTHPRAETGQAVPDRSPLASAAPAGVAVVGGLLLWRLLAGLLARRESELHPRAQAVLAAVCAAPGLSFRGLRQATGLANGVALHHVARLLRDGHIVAHRHRNTVRFFENHGRYARTWKEAAVLRDPQNRRLHAWIASHAGATQAAVVEGSRGWGWRRGLTQKRLALLEEAGLVSRARDGRAVRYMARSASAVSAAPLPGRPEAIAPVAAVAAVSGGPAASAAKL